MRGEGDMAIQTICQILPYKEIELVGPLPAEIEAWIDMSTAVSARAQHPDAARALIRYLLRAESDKVWKPRGLERFHLTYAHNQHAKPSACSVDALRG